MMASNDRGDDPALKQIRPIHAEHVTEQDVVEMQLRLDLGVEHDAEAEHAGEHDAHDRILLDAAVLLQIAGGERADHAGCEGTHRQRQTRDIRQDHTRQHRMRDRVAHERPALEHQETRQQSRWHRDQHGDHEGFPHERKGEGQGERVEQADHGLASDAARMRRRAASSPCLGARKKAVRKTSVCRTMMMPPVAPSRK